MRVAGIVEELRWHLSPPCASSRLLSPLEDFSKLGISDEYSSRSDHALFARLESPVAFLFSDVHEDYHRPGDDPEKIDNDKIRRVARLVLRALAEMQTDVVELR